MPRESNTAPIGFVGMLTILFIALKLTGVIGWGWQWVLSPVIFSAALVAALTVTAIVAAIVIAKKRGRK